MKYISEIYALNVPCSLNTPGDWHTPSYSIKNANFFDTETAFYKEYGIEKHIIDDKEYNIANHIRAILDLLYNQKFDLAQCFKKDFIVVDEYDEQIMDKVYQMKKLPYWEKIDKTMQNEYLFEWDKYKEKNE